MEAKALFVRDGESFVGTSLTQGGWDPAVANGGAVLALLGHCLDEIPTLVPMTLDRLTADLHRPVPVGRPLRVVSEVAREGKKLQLVELKVLVDEIEHARVTALRLRVEEIGDDAPSSTTATRPGDALQSPEASRDVRKMTPVVPGFLHAFDMRRARRSDGKGMGAWLRLEASVVSGRPVSPSARLAAIFDFANLVGMDEHPMTVSMINPDVTAHVLRPPVGEWIAITGDTRFEPRLGRGVSSAEYSDTDGVFAVGSTSQLVQRR